MRPPKRLQRFLILVASLLLPGCPDQTRCRYTTDCDEGQVCSNENDFQGDGVCISPCERHIAAAECVDAAPPPVDAASDSALDASTPDTSTDAEIDR